MVDAKTAILIAMENYDFDWDWAASNLLDEHQEEFYDTTITFQVRRKYVLDITEDREDCMNDVRTLWREYSNKWQEKWRMVQTGGTLDLKEYAEISPVLYNSHQNEVDAILKYYAKLEEATRILFLQKQAVSFAQALFMD